MLDQINLFNLRGSEGKVDYLDWFRKRFPNTMKQSEETIKNRIEEKIEKNFRTHNYQRTFEVEDVDIPHDMKRFGDSSQTLWERHAKIGNFEIKAEKIEVQYLLETSKAKYKATLYILEQTGATFNFCEDGWTALFSPICWKRYVRMGEWQIEGEKSIPCTPPLSEIPVPIIDFSQFQVPDQGLWVPNVWQNFSGALGR